MPYANHPEWEAFRSAIVADWRDDTVRLAAADWLDEHGDPDRAAFIRIQVELARTDPKSLDADHLRVKERAYLGPLSHFRGLWGATDCPQLVRVKPATGRGSLALDVTGEDRVAFWRGFVQGVDVPAIEWLHHGPAVRARNPVETVILRDCDHVTRDQWYQMMGSGALTGLETLVLADATGSTHEWLRGFLPGTVVETIS
ncbi:MAG TPA: TIGR02996 domain-containing protein [Gemmataceae bacterium]|nr:TIGR02996 domain-containing protein [Gemmataceae bacterium]